MSDSDSAQPSLRSLYKKILASPNTTTRPERNQIQGRPPPDEEDNLSLSATSYTYPALVQKAINEPAALTEIEARILSQGAQLPSLEDRNKTIAGFKAMPKEDYKLMDEAWQASGDSDETDAQQVAWQTLQRIREEKRAVARREKIAARATSGPAVAQKKGWVKKLEEKGWDEWGFVCLRTSYRDEEAWARVKDRMASITVEALSRVSAADAIRGKWRINYVEDQTLESMSAAGLRERFNTFVEAGNLPEGIRRDYFLSADNTVMTSFQHGNSPVIPVWEARFNASESHKSGYSGAVAVLPSLLLATVYPMILMEEPTPLQTLHLMAGR